MLAALLTPPGRGAIAIVHLCGEGSGSIVRELFGKDISDRPKHGKLTHGGETVDEVMVRTVAGFTGEETVEISCHGGNVPVERVMRALAARGARRVEAAELLDRGVETGHLDRIRAEAWALLPRAKTERAARVLQDQAEGALSRAVQALKSPEGAGPLLTTAPLGQALVSPKKVVIAGRPNVGKSTLFNALVERDRVIVSPEPGTTRDPVREIIAIDQIPIELVDTAGMETPRDLLEQLSIERTRDELKSAEAILFLFDAEAGAQGDELRFLEQVAHRRLILIVNKVDVGAKKPLLEALPISAKTGQGLDEIRRRILRTLELRPRYSPGEAVVFTPRQEKLLREAANGQRTIEAVREDLLRGPA